MMAKAKTAPTEAKTAPTEVDAVESGRLPSVKLIAAVHGFYKGAIVNPGQSFMFDPNPSVPGGKVKFPKWAAPEGEKAAKAKPELKAFDTRPAAAVAAAKMKAGALGNAN